MRSLTSLALLPLTGSLVPFLRQPAPPQAAATETAVQALRERLREGPGPVRIVIFGDSLAAGWGPKDPKADAYSAVFARALAARYPSCTIEAIAAGGPGDASDVGLIRLENDVLRRRPDVVVIQFGGNDERLKRSARDLTDSLVAMVHNIRAALPNALCLIATPPMNDPEPATPYVRATVFAAQEVSVPVADFDGALRAADRDFRGPFCWGAHPGAYSHLTLGRELLRAWDALLEVPNPLTVRLEGYSRVLRDGDAPPLRVQVRNNSKTPLSVGLDCGAALPAYRKRLDLAPEAGADVDQSLVPPEPDVSHRTRVYRLWALARSVEAQASDLDTKWLAIAPVVVPDVAEDDAEPERLSWHAFGADSLVRGDWSWKGDADLSARFAVLLGTKALTFVVEVTDNDLDAADDREHLTDGDSVEVCLDLRPASDQGKPVYSRDVVLLLVKPGAREGEAATWEPLDDLTPRLAGVTAESGLTDNGYVVRVSVPRAALDRGDAEGLTGLGFDVHVNDADFGLGRERQLVWAGTQDNFLDPSALAALAEPGEETPRWRASLR
jgi:lysophospholipase L1-like esterase